MQKIVLVDDHPMILKGLFGLLEEELDFTVCGQFENAETALDSFEALAPDLIVTDIRLPGMDGIELVQHLKEINSALKVLVLSRLYEEIVARQVLQAGANGYIMKSEPAEELMKAVRKVLDGGIYLSNAVSEKMLKSLSHGHNTFMQRPEEYFSTRELQVYGMLARGFTSNLIAADLGISVKTVESYHARIKEKLNVDTKTDLIRHAVHWLATTEALS